MSEPKEMMRVSVCDDKYTVIQYSDYSTAALRYGESWPAFEHAGLDNLHLALAREVAELREQLAAMHAASRVGTDL